MAQHVVEVLDLQPAVLDLLTDLHEAQGLAERIVELKHLLRRHDAQRCIGQGIRAQVLERVAAG